MNPPRIRALVDFLIGLSLLLLLWMMLMAGGCMVRPLDRTIGSLSDLADRLVVSVEKRADPQRLRLLIYEFHDTSTTGPHAEKPDGESVGHAGCSLAPILENEFVLRLSPRLNVLEPLDIASEDGNGDGTANAGFKHTAQLHGANAVLVGSYVEIGEEVYVSLRVIDIETMLVIAAARGVFEAHSLRLLGGTDDGHGAHGDDEHDRHGGHDDEKKPSKNKGFLGR